MALIGLDEKAGDKASSRMKSTQALNLFCERGCSLRMARRLQAHKRGAPSHWPRAKTSSEASLTCARVVASPPKLFSDASGFAQMLVDGFDGAFADLLAFLG